MEEKEKNKIKTDKNKTIIGIEVQSKENINWKEELLSEKKNPK